MATTNRVSSFKRLSARIGAAVSRRTERRRRVRAERIAARLGFGLSLEPLENRVLMSMTGAYGLVELAGQQSTAFSSATGSLNIDASGNVSGSIDTSVNTGNGSAISTGPISDTVTEGTDHSLTFASGSESGYVSLDSNIAALTTTQADGNGTTSLTLLLRQGSGLSDAAVNGNYGVVALGIEVDKSGDLVSTVVSGSGHASGAGSMSASIAGIEQGQSTGAAFTNTGPGNFTFSIGSNGLLTSKSDSGWVSPDGSVVVWGYDVQQYNYVEMFMAIRQTSGHSAADLNGQYYMEGLDRSDASNTSSGIGYLDFNGKGGVSGSWTNVAQGQATANGDQAGSLTGTYTVSSGGEVVISASDGSKYTAFLNADNSFGAWASVPGDKANHETGEGVLIEASATPPPAPTPAKLVFAMKPVSTTAGKVMAPVVINIEDAHGKVQTGDDAAVTLGIATGPNGGAFTGSSTTTVNAVNGVATFNNLSFDTAGSYTLSAADSSDSLSNINSASFKITPAAVADVTFGHGPSNVVAGQKITPPVTVLVTDLYGNSISSSKVTLTIHNAVGGASVAAFSAVTSATGVATFSAISTHVAGQYFLMANDGAVNSPASGDFVVSPAAAASVAFVQKPTNITAGQSISPAMTALVKDVYGNVISGASVALAVKSKPVGGALLGTLSATTNASGLATFSGISAQVAGKYTLSATVGKLSSPAATLTVVPANPAQLVFASPIANANVAKKFKSLVVVRIEDAYGNIVTGSESINLTIASGPGTFTGTSTTTVNAVKGLATFKNLILGTAGTYQIEATDSTDSLSVTSGIFTIA